MLCYAINKVLCSSWPMVFILQIRQCCIIIIIKHLNFIALYVLHELILTDSWCIRQYLPPGGKQSRQTFSEISQNNSLMYRLLKHIVCLDIHMKNETIYCVTLNVFSSSYNTHFSKPHTNTALLLHIFLRTDLFYLFDYLK